MISSNNPSGLPPIDKMKKLCQSAALLDAILQPEWDLRYFSFDSKWDENEMMASMNDGEGSGYFILFNPNGAILIGHSPHSPVGVRVERAGSSLPGVFDHVPPELSYALREPAFLGYPITFCLWRRYTDSIWYSNQALQMAGKDPDSSSELLFIFDGSPKTYKDWSEEYFEVSVPIQAIEEVYQHSPLTARLVKRINPHRMMPELLEDILQIGYPTL